MNQPFPARRAAPHSGVPRENLADYSRGTLYGLWVLGWVVTCMMGIFGYTHSNTATAMFLAGTSVGAVILGRWHANFITERARVLGAKLVPVHLWQQAWAESRAKVARVWLIMVLGLVTVLLPEAPVWHVLTFLAVASAAQACSSLVTLGAGGLLQRVWLWVPALLGLVMLVGAALGVGVVATVQWLDAIPPSAKGAMALSWPALMLTLSRAWRSVPEVQKPATGLSFFALFGAFQRRYVFLRVDANWGSNVIFLIPFLTGASTKPVQMPWGDGVTSDNLVFQLLLIIASSWLLAYRDLHWRALLAPGLVPAGSIGTQIVRNSLEVWAGFWLLMAALVFAVQWLDSGFTGSSIVEATEAYAFLPLQLLCAVSIAALIRGSKPTLHWELKALGFAFALWLTLLVLGVTGVHLPTEGWFEAGYGYVLVLLLVSAVSLWRANRVWTVERLARFAPERQPAPPGN